MLDTLRRNPLASSLSFAREEVEWSGLHTHRGVGIPSLILCAVKRQHF